MPTSEVSSSRAALFSLYASYGSTYEAVNQLNMRDLQQFHLHAANELTSRRLTDCVMLNQVKARNGFSGAEREADLIPLLFPHTAYKSYPMRWIEDRLFDRLTKWMQNFTTVDLGEVDMDGVRSVDDWIGALDAGSDLRIAHTFGTSGKLSFIPRSKDEWIRGGATLRLLIRDFEGSECGPDLMPGDRPLIYPSYRFGANSGGRSIDGVVDTIAGGEDNTLFLYPSERFSADVASFGGRLKRLQELSSNQKLVVPPELLARRDELARVERERPARLERFLHEASERYAGKDVYIFMLWPMAIDWAEEGASRGRDGLFGRGTIFVTGGGLKGRAFAPGWRENVLKFLGVDKCYELYGMTESQPQNLRCEEGNYHIHRLVIPLVLDPKTGHELPRKGEQTGRYAAVDLNATTMWGGFVSGDRVTMGGWDTCCSCGRTGYYVRPDISRFSEVEGGTDKISCAGAPQAHDNAIRYVLSELGEP